MNSYIAMTIFGELKDSIQKCCGCPRICISKICAASGTAVLIPTVFWLQFTAVIVDHWLMENDTMCDDSDCSQGYFGCSWSYNESICLCALEVTSIVILGLLMVVGFGVCCRACCRGITLESCKICYVCILSLLSLIPGILSVCCCLVTVKFVSDHRDKQLTYGFSFYVYTITGIVTLVISLASICGYICVKSCELREDFEIRIGSDDGDREDASLLNTN